MDHRDALAPLIELVGVFAGSAASPLTAVAIFILALCLTRYSSYLLLAAAVGMSDGAFGEVTGVTTVGFSGNAARCRCHPAPGMVRLAGRVRHEEHRRFDSAAVRPGLRSSGLKK